MGVGLPPLEFTDCLTDSPYFRDNLHAHEKELEKTSEQIKRLVKEVKALLSAAKHLSRAQRTLSCSLQNFSFDCIGTSQTDDELVISKSLGEFGKLIALVEDERDRMLDRAYDQVIFPLENFRKEHIGGVKEGKKKFDKQTAKFCQSQERYLNLSTKKQDTVLQEADATLEMEQRHFCQASLEYVFLLQEVQERKKFEFVETLLGFMFGWLTFYHQGHEVAEDFKPYMKELQFRIQKTRENFNATRDKTESLMKKMLEMRQAKQTVDEGAPNKVYSKEGYLFLMEKKKLGTTTWTKHYCMYQRDKKEFIMYPYNQMTGKFNTQEKMILGSCVRRMSDTIEKRFCFDLTPEDRPGVVYTLQALSEEDRKQWMDVMDGKEPTYSVPGTVKQQKAEERTLDDIGFAFVQKCIEVLESRGLDEQGLYRVVGVRGKVNKLIEMGLDRRKADKLNLDDPCEWESKTITSALKKYLSSLREPLMTFRYHNSFISAAKFETRAQRVNMVHALLHKLPNVNFRMLNILMKHLVNVTAHSDKNLMTVSNLSVCFGPTLLRPEKETVAAIMDIKFCNVVVEILIDNYNKIFKTAPELVDVDSRESSPLAYPSSPPTPPLSQALRAKYTTTVPPVSHAVIKASYYDTPTLAVSLSSSQPSVSSARDRDRDYYGARPSPRPSLPTYAIPDHLSHHKPSPTPPYYYAGLVNSDPVNSTSSSNESVSSLSSRDVTNHNSYSSITPQKSKRGLPMGGSKMSLHYATSYRPQDNVPPGTPNSLSSGRSSPGFSQGPRRVRTLYACMGENDGELSFEPNQIITNVRTSLEPGWLEGTLNGKTGLVPENYVELLP
ncbi:rho GTPase-activating protein 26 isoform X2 [Macrosteles quadrilineatus]|uniref:rho GTPase-activating protein 26 isoform X2 n=1 Tax=Macrosteles quadrilineatus TaxID=74068 RepID=UPI0023E1DD97|nr:rho GTPase-activating protein 26 isoform X2 [Macrosteles quadrilineatus]